MKRSINILSLTGLVCAVLLTIYLFHPLTTGQAAFDRLPLNQPQVVNFNLNNEALEGMTRREKLDQMRDWLLYTVVSASGHSAKEISDILYDLPAVRYGYMQHVGNFEYGETRSRLIGAGEVVALVPADDTQNRSDQLAHIADEHRKNTGEIPHALLVFEYRLNLDERSGELTRREPIAGQELFTQKYGYVESKIKSTADLQQFMGQVDDVVFARQDGDALRLGGRRLKGHQYRGVSVEDIAAIWQSEHKIQAGLKTFDNKQLVTGSGFSLDPTYHFDEIKKFFESTLVPVSELAQALDSPALSDEERLSANPLYQKLFKSPAKPTSSKRPPTAVEVSAALDRCDIDPFFDWLSNLRQTQPELVEKLEQDITNKVSGSKGAAQKSVTLEEAIVHEFGFQQARYDGDLQGTEVGMVLFYTDLVAKLWDFDFKASAPRAINDFKSELEIGEHKISPVYRKQLEEMPYARLWFDPDKRGYQPVNSGQSLFFARKATRLLAKSSSSILQRDEVEPDASMATYITWWDDHYEEIARYEPQYERLNQIMKWSLIVTWLNQANKGQYLAFLNDYPVNHSYRFPDWVRQQPDLRFNKWEAIKFFPPGGKCSTTETLPMLVSAPFALFGDKNRSWYLSGGVSLGNEEAFAGRTFLSEETRVADIARRADLDYAPLKSAEDALQTLEGESYKFETVADDSVLIKATPKSGAMLRTPYGDLAPGSFEHVLTDESMGLRVQARYGATEIGDLTVQRAGNGFEIGWQSRELDLGQSLARQMSLSREPQQVLASNPLVQSAIKFPGGKGYLVRLRDSEQWLRFVTEDNPATTIADGWQARFAETSGPAKPIEVAWWNQARVQAELKEAHLLISRTGAASTSMEILPELPATGGTRVKLISGDVSINALADTRAGSISVRFGELPAYLQENPGALQQALAKAELSSPNLAHDGVIKLADLHPLQDESLARLLSNNRYEEAAQQLTKAPADFKLALDKNYAQALQKSDALSAAGDYARAQDQLNELIQIYGAKPELTIRQSIVLIKNGRVSQAMRTLNESLLEGQVNNRAAFFDEINLRLKDSGIAPPGTSISFTSEGKELAVHCQLNNLSAGTSVRPETIDLDSAFFYIEDSPTFSNIDWNTNIQSTLRELISGDLGEVVRLPAGDLTKFRPTEIYASELGTKFSSVRQITTPSSIRISVIVGNGQKCDREEADTGNCGDVYLVVGHRRN
jgi:Tetratricopeptide repeat